MPTVSLGATTGVGTVIDGTVMEGTVKEGSVNDSKERGVTDTGVNDSGVTEIGVKVKEGNVGTAPPMLPPVQSRFSQQRCAPLKMTQWKPASQDSPFAQHSPPFGAQVPTSQHVRPTSQAPPPLVQHV